MKKTILTILLGCLASLSYAEDMVYPGRGASMSDVQKQVGEPDKKLDAVGEPPISRWVYEKFTVYFENETVIHTVKNVAAK